MKNKTLPVLFFAMISFSGLAQKGFDPGYVVTANFDTLKGFIKLQSNYMNSKACIFMKPGDLSPRTYSPSELISYRIQNRKYYVSKEVTIDSVKRILFLEYLVHGIADLYYLKEQAGELYFIDKDNLMTSLDNNGKNISRMVAEGTVDERTKTYYQPSFQYKRMMTYLFQDSKETLKEIPNLPFNYRSLINITVDYHNTVCKDRECIDYTKSAIRHIFLEPWVGYQKQWMGVKESRDIAESSGIIAGVNLRLKPFKGYSNWDILFGLNLSKSLFDKDFGTTIYKAATPGYEFVFRTHAAYSLLRIPVSVEYTLPTKKIKPFISMSFINAVIPDFVYSCIRIDQNQGRVTQQFSNYLLGASAGVGFKYQFKGGSYIILKNEIEYIRPAQNEGWLFDNSHVYSYRINLGYGLRLK